MARTKVVFGPAANVAAPGLDGVALRFKFGVHRPEGGARRDSLSYHAIRVEASRSLLSTWGMQGLADQDPTIASSLFQFALEEIKSSINEGRFPSTKDVVLNTQSQPHEYPFDITKLVPPNGYVLEFDEGEAEAESGENE